MDRVASAQAASLKSCCAALYADEWVRLLLGESFHPGGLALTGRLGILLRLGPGQRVLDVASGNGASAIFLAQQFGCQVLGVEFSAGLVAEANATAEQAGLADKVRFILGDAESLPVGSSEFDAALCECAFCTFPDKQAAAAEFARVLRAGGRLGLSDLTRSGPLPKELDTLLAWIACIADARPLAEYVGILKGASFEVGVTELHADALSKMISGIRSKLLGAQLLLKLNKLDWPGIDFEQGNQLARRAAEAVRNRTLGYALIAGIKR